MQAVLCYLASLYVRFVHATGSWTIEGEATPDKLRDEGQPFVLAFWHARLLMMGYAWRHKTDVNMLISGHSDGRYVALTIGHFGVSSIIGSSTRGGWSAMRTIVRTLRNGGVVGITPDGPQGPRMRASEGVITIARMAKVPVLPLAYSVSRRKVFATWDRFVLPLPFSRGVFLWGDPILISEDADEATMEAKRQELENSLLVLTERADRLMGQPVIEPAPLESPSVHASGASNSTRTESSETPANVAAGIRQ